MSACLAEAPSGGYEQLKAEPEADLLFPGSERLSDGGYDASMTIDGTQPAAFWLIAGSNARVDEVLAWYEGELDDRGWRPQATSFSTTEIDAFDWVKDEVHFRLGILDTREWYLRIDGSDAFATLFEVRLERGWDVPK